MKNNPIQQSETTSNEAAATATMRNEIFAINNEAESRIANTVEAAVMTQAIPPRIQRKGIWDLSLLLRAIAMTATPNGAVKEI